MSWLLQGQQSLTAALKCIILVTVIGGDKGWEAGGGGTRHCTATPNNCFNEDCGALCVATPCLIDRCHLIRDDRDRIVAILTSKSTMFSRRDFDIDNDLRLG